MITSSAVVMAIHNGGWRLKRQVESIVSQTVRPEFAILVDDETVDGSVEDSRQLLGSAGIRCIVVPGSSELEVNSRIAKNFEKGLLVAAGFCQHIALADQDDIWLPDRMSSQLERMARRGVLLTCGRVLAFDELSMQDLGDLGDVFPVGIPVDLWWDAAFRQRVRDTVTFPSVIGAASMLSSDLVKCAAPFPAGWLHDRWLALVAVSQDGLDQAPTSVIRYRVHSGQSVGLTTARTKASCALFATDAVRQATVLHRLGRDVSARGGHLLDLVPRFWQRQSGEVEASRT